MASIGYEGLNNELTRILFRDAQGKQQTLRLGKCSKKNTALALAMVEHLLEAKQHDTAPHYDAVRWLERIDDQLHARVVALGLARPRDVAVVTLGMLLEQFETTATVKESTRAAYRQTTNSLREFFGADIALSQLTAARADAWRKWITEPAKRRREDESKPAKKLARATVAKRVHVAKSIFKRAIRWGFISSSPFADLRAGSQANPDRLSYVDQETILAVLDACPTAQWRAVVALARYAGLRCPSEIEPLRWSDVNWKRKSLTVRSPKTAAHEGHAVRIVPIEGALLSILQELLDASPLGVDAMIPMLRDSTVNLRTTLSKIVARAGVKPWPRMFQNLRASCECDWVERHPNHEVASWMGHSTLIASRHYLQASDKHFDLAAGFDSRIQKPATNPATQVRTPRTTRSHAQTQKPQDPADLVGVGVGCNPVEIGRMGEVGFELHQFSAGNTRVAASGGNKSGNTLAPNQAATPQPTLIDPELATVVAVWSTLPPALRRCVLELIAAGSDGFWRKS